MPEVLMLLLLMLVIQERKLFFHLLKEGWSVIFKRTCEHYMGRAG